MNLTSYRLGICRIIPLNSLIAITSFLVWLKYFDIHIRKNLRFEIPRQSNKICTPYSHSSHMGCIQPHRHIKNSYSQFNSIQLTILKWMEIFLISNQSFIYIFKLDACVDLVFAIDLSAPHIEHATQAMPIWKLLLFKRFNRIDTFRHCWHSFC